MSKVNPALIAIQIVRIDFQCRQFESGKGADGYLYSRHHREFGITTIKLTTLGMVHANSTMSATTLSKMGRIMRVLMPEMIMGADIYISVVERQRCR